jgi:invasion protein IalB
MDNVLTLGIGRGKSPQQRFQKDRDSMPRHQITLPVALLLAVSMPVYAQDTTTTEPGTETTPVAEASTEEPVNTESDLSLGEEVDDTPKVGEQYVSETIGAWQMRCLKTEDGSDPCQMYQLLDDQEGPPVAEFSMFRLPEGQQARAGATVIVPLETSLQAQLTISVDGGKGKRYPYSFCNQVGCFARIGLTDQDIQVFKRGNEATLTIVPALAPDQKVIVQLSLEGFTAGYAKVSVVEP